MNRADQYRRVFDEGPNALRKRGDSFRLRREVEAMKYVRSRTSVPIPAVLDVHLDEDADEAGWFIMECLSGRELGDAWTTMGVRAREQTMLQLKSYLEQLHRLQPPAPGWIGSCSGGPAYDHRLNNMSTCGPFASVGEFHDFLVAPVNQCPRPECVAKYRRLLPDTHGIRFAHADLSWENILVDPETGNITGIIDWEMAGFWPEWWEFRKALFGARSQPWWLSLLRKVMQEHLTETEADMELEMF